MHAVARACMFVALIGISPTQPAIAQSPDPFLAQHQAAVSRNLPTTHFEIRFKGGRTTFNPREPIDVELVFDPPSIVDDHPWLAFCRDGWPMSNFVLDRPDAVSTPQTRLCQDLAERPALGVLGGRPGGSIGGPPRPKPPPAVLTRIINDWYRFDRPGVYRVYAQSAHPTGDGFDGPRYTSNVLTFTVTARDPSYERARVDAASAILLADAASIRARRGALLELRRLASDGAAAALAHFYPPSHHAMPGSEEDVVMGGLLMVPDRAAAVAALEAELRRPERQVSPQLVRDLASLEMARRGMRSTGVEAEMAYLTLVEHYAAERARVLDAVPGRLQGAFREDLLDGARHSRFYRGALGPVTSRHPREVATAFLSLPVDVQTKLLTDSWRRFAHPAFLPLIRHLALAADGADDALREIALRRWHELAPAATARALRRERVGILPRVSIETLALLAEPAPASVQAEWIRVLSASANDMVVTSAAERLERFGTRAGARGAARVWRRKQETLPLDASGALIAFLLRVDREAGVIALREALAGIPSERDPGNPHAWHGLLWQVGTREWNPAVEATAIEGLSHGDRIVRDDAARLLGEFGSPAARRPIEASLAAANARFTPGSREAEDALRTLAEALNWAGGWTLTREEARAWAARCTSDFCAYVFRAGGAEAEPIRTISVSDPVLESERYYVVGGVRLPTEAALVAKLSQYPRGTRFAWFDRRRFFPEMEQWTAAERAAVRQRIARQVAPVGIEITTEAERVP